MMELVVAGLSHKSSPLALRERLALLPTAAVYENLRRKDYQEAVVLSTCNRFELYLCCEPESGRAETVLGLFEDIAGFSLSPHAYVYRGPRAVLHLFEVAAGLDSLVVGETEILGQVKSAYESAQTRGMTGKYANILFQRALYVGKKVRNDTAITVGQTSVASVAVQLAESIFGSLSDSAVLILGAGAMAELTARHLLSKKVARLTISNRTWERGAVLAEKLKAEALAWDKFPAALAQADIVIASTGSVEPVLTQEAVLAAVAQRAGRSLFIIDIAMPRDVQDCVHALEHVYLYRLEDLETIVAHNLENRGGEVARARALAQEKAEEFSHWKNSWASGRESSLKHSSEPSRAAAAAQLKGSA